MSILINIASEFTGKKAFQQAEKATKNLDFSVKKLGKSLGVALSVSAVVAFGKASAKAFIEDEKAAKMLANTVDNLGLSFANPQISKFIDEMERATGVADDMLRPAMAKLLSTTGSVANSQALLNQAIGISRGSGEDLSTVIDDLTKAYTGQTKGLEKYKLGLTKAELQAMTFEQIMGKLNNRFKGANAAYMDTYAYKMDLLTAAAGRAQETIGKGLIDALMELTGNTDIQGLISDIDSFAQGLADTLVLVGKLLAPIVNGLRGIFKFLGTTSEGGAFGQSAADQFKKGLENNKALYPKEGNNAIYGYKMTAEQKAAADAAAKAEAAAAKRAKDLANMLKKNTTELKRQATAKKQNALFDLDIIQRMAALQGKITEEEKLRLNLQLALLTGNEVQAAKLAGQLADSIDKTGQLKKWLTELPDANNPFKGWDEWLKNFKANLASVTSFAPATVNPPATNAGGFNVSVGASTTGVTSSATGDIIINIAGSVTSEEDLVAKIRAGIQSGSLSGKPSDIGRLAGMFG